MLVRYYVYDDKYISSDMIREMFKRKLTLERFISESSTNITISYVVSAVITGHWCPFDWPVYAQIHGLLCAFIVFPFLDELSEVRRNRARAKRIGRNKK
jgi:hypothetical protein